MDINNTQLNQSDQMRQRDLQLEYDAAQKELDNIQNTKDWYEYLLQTVPEEQLPHEAAQHLLAIMDEGLTASREKINNQLTVLEQEMSGAGLETEPIDYYVDSFEELDAQYADSLTTVSNEHIQTYKENPNYNVGDNLVRDGEALFRIHVEKAVDQEMNLAEGLKAAYDNATKLTDMEKLHDLSVKTGKEIDKQDAIRSEIADLQSKKEMLQPMATEALKTETARYANDIERIKNTPNTVKGKLSEAWIRVKDVFTGNKENRNQQAIDKINEQRVTRTEEFEIYKQQLLNSISMAEASCNSRISELQQQLNASIERSNQYQQILSQKDEKLTNSMEQGIDSHLSLNEKLALAHQMNIEDRILDAEKHVLETGEPVSFLDQESGNIYTISLAKDDEKEIPFKEYELGPGEYDNVAMNNNNQQKNEMLEYSVTTNSQNTQQSVVNKTTKNVDRHYFKDALSGAKKVISVADRKLQQMEQHMAQSIGR